MASRLIIWILVTLMSLQGAFAASLFHCLPTSQEEPSLYVSLVTPAMHSAATGFRKSLPQARASLGTRQHNASSHISASCVEHHAMSHDDHHSHKMPCCDSASGGISSFSFLFPPSIKVLASPEQTHKLLNVFLDGPKRPPRLFLA